MKFGWPISIFFHTLFLLMGLLALSSRIDTDRQDLIIPVEILTVTDKTNVKAAIKPPKPEPKPVEEVEQPPMQLETPMPNAETKGAAREAAPKEATPEKKPEVTPEKTDEAAVPPPEKKETKPAFDLNKYAEIIDKTRESQPEIGQQKALQSETNFYNFAEKARESAGAGTELTISEIDLLRSAMYKCWRIPLDAKNPEELGVEVRVKLAQDGSVQSVQLVNQAKIAVSSNPYMAVAAQRAVNAVSKCAPYDFLPPEKYSKWQDMTLRFQPET